jgi:Mg2+ and Co2+ transporter CorA
MLNDSLQRVFHFPCHTDGIDSPNACKCALHKPAEPSKQGAINAFYADFTRVLSSMEEYQKRIDRLTSVVTAIISIDDSRRGQDDNRNVARLTWLATFFIPLGYMASLFSMQSDISTLKDTYRLYFETALPLAAGTLGVALILGLPSVQSYARLVLNFWTSSDG